MALTELERGAERAARSAAELGEDVAQLRAAVGRLRAQLAGVERERDDIHLLLGAARALEHELRGAWSEAEAEAALLRRRLEHARALAAVRGRLLEDIVSARRWSRASAIRRAERVERLIAS